jgi:hypothetical protein
MRSSLEVLQRMANGLDPFDLNRFRCAVAALPHETPKLSARVTSLHVGGGNYAQKLEAALRLAEIEKRGLRVIEVKAGLRAAADCEAASAERNFISSCARSKRYSCGRLRALA